MTRSLPVLLYHYINAVPNSIAVDPDLFEEHLSAMAAQGWRGISLDEAAGYLLEGKELPAKSALITFDDGFLDNYVFAAPLLRKHGHRGVVFAVTGRMVDEDLPRPTLDDVWAGFVDMTELPQAPSPARSPQEGLRLRRDLFFSWKEARALEAGGVLRVEGHSHRHRSVFTASDFKTVFKPEMRKRTFDRLDADIVFGLPRFPQGPALAQRAFLPAPRLYDLVRELVPQSRVEAHQFFANPANEAKVLAKIREIPEDELGRLEGAEEFHDRLTQELAACREALRINLGRDPLALAWPWGGSCPEALDIAKAMGFRLFFATTLGPNLPGGQGGDPAHIHRFKAKNKPGKWLLSRLNIYASPFKAKLYAKLHK